jgi:hypothetical protein
MQTAAIPKPSTAASAPDSMFAAWSPDGNAIVYTSMRLLRT